MEVDGLAGLATMRAMKERTNSGSLLSRRFHLVLLHLTEQARRDLDAMVSRPEPMDSTSVTSQPFTGSWPRSRTNSDLSMSW